MSPAQGRFQSVDPGNAGADPSDPQTWNMYSYVTNNPLSYTDPSGMGFWSDLGNFFLGIGEMIFNDLTFGQGNVLWGGNTLGGLASCGGPLGNCGDLGNGPWSENPGLGNVQNPGAFVMDFSSQDSSSGAIGGPAASDVLSYVIPGVAFQAQGIGKSPVDTRNLISKARANLSKTCDTKFGAVIPNYTNAAFFSSLLSAEIRQYPLGTPNMPANRVFGAYADTVVTEPGAPIRLFPNFYGLSPAQQGFALVHEGIHHFTRWDDPTVFQKFRTSGLRQANTGTHDITLWIQGGCRQ
jgi:hypothetical protein